MSREPLEHPGEDEHDRALRAEVRPPGWSPPAPASRYNLVVVGGGTAGLVAATGAAGLGAKVALVERDLLGGDCLNTGCVPSKALLRAGRAAAALGAAGELGIEVDGGRADFGRVAARMRRVRAHIAHHDSAHALREAGVDVFFGEGRFVADDAIEVAGTRLRFARAILATGGRPAAPPVPGLAEAGYHTSETVFSLRELPRRLVIIGAGPIGCELAQAFRRLGAEVHVVALDERVLPQDDPDAAGVVQARLEAEGVRLSLGARILRVERRTGGALISFERAGLPGEAVGDEILVAAGRSAALGGLDPGAAGIACTDQGVVVDDRLRTSNRRVYAAGDVASRFRFTHAADALARIALQNALFFGRKKASALRIPWCTYTDPEVAHVGAREGTQTFTVPLAEVDRAILDGDTGGFARIHADRRGRILGATLVASHAGESIGTIVVAMNAGVRLGALSAAIHPYPTTAEVWRKLGDAYQRTRLTPGIQRLLARLMEWRR